MLPCFIRTNDIILSTNFMNFSSGFCAIQYSQKKIYSRFFHSKLEYENEKQAENIKIEEGNSINYEEAENNLMHCIPRPILPVENVQRHRNIPNILHTSISNFYDILHSSWWQSHIVRVTVGTIYIIVSASWLCRFQLLTIRWSQRPLLHLRGATFDGEKYERAYVKKIMKTFVVNRKFSTLIVEVCLC